MRNLLRETNAWVFYAWLSIHLSLGNTSLIKKITSFQNYSPDKFNCKTRYRSFCFHKLKHKSSSFSVFSEMYFHENFRKRLKINSKRTRYLKKRNRSNWWNFTGWFTTWLVYRWPSQRSVFFFLLVSVFVRLPFLNVPCLLKKM